MKRKRLSAKANCITVSLAGLRKSEFYCIVFYDNSGKQLHREKVSGISSFSFQIAKADGLYVLEIQNDRAENIYEENFFVKRSVHGAYVDEDGKIVFRTPDFTERIN